MTLAFVIHCTRRTGRVRDESSDSLNLVVGMVCSYATCAIIQTREQELQGGNSGGYILKRLRMFYACKLIFTHKSSDP